MNAMKTESRSGALTPATSALLREFAAKYIWWKTPTEAMACPRRVMAQVMDIGTLDDNVRLLDAAGGELLAAVLANASPGWFSPRSWAFWHCKLGLSDAHHIPPMPRRRFD